MNMGFLRDPKQLESRQSRTILSLKSTSLHEDKLLIPN